VFSELLLEPGDIAHLTGAWDAEEQAAFQEALSALAQASPSSLANAASRQAEQTQTSETF
jgi:hypothetical protein